MGQEQHIHWDSMNAKKLDLRYYESIGKVARMTLWGGIIFAIWGIIGLIVALSSSNTNTLWDYISLILERGILLYMCIRAYNALIYRKKNAIFLTRCILCVCLLYLFLTIVLCLYSNQISRVFNIYSLLLLIWCIYGLICMASDNEFQVVFPKSCRSHSIFDILLVLIYLVFPSTCSFIGGLNKTNAPTNETKSVAIQRMNSECPFTTDWGGLVTSVEQNESAIVFKCDISEMFNMETLSKYKDVISENFIQYLQTLPTSSPLYIKNLFAWNKDVIMSLRKESGETLDIAIHKEKLATAVGKKPTAYGRLKAQIGVMNMDLPVEVEDGVTLVEVSLSSDFIIYHYEIDEELIDMTLLTENEEELNEVHKEDIAENRNIIAICQENRKGVSFQYVGNKSKQKVEINFTVEEVVQLW